HEHAVEQNGARAALALLARVLRPGHVELLAQGEEQRLALPAVRLALDAVHAERDPHASVLSRARRVITRSACRRYAAAPRTSSIGSAASATRSGNASASSIGEVRRRGVGEADPNDAHTTPRSRSARSASEHTAITIALRGPTFMNVCSPMPLQTCTA